MHALAILTDLPRINEWPFTTGRDAPVTYATVRNTFAKAASTAGLVDVRLHDLRRTVMPRAAMAGVGTHVLRARPARTQDDRDGRPLHPLRW